MKPKPRARLLRKIADYLMDKFPAGLATQKKTRQTIAIPPLLTPLQFDGESLADFMIPTLNISDESINEGFARIVFQQMQPDLLQGETVWTAISHNVIRLVRGSPERFVVWLGQQPGWEMEQGANSLFAHKGEQVLGIVEGIVHCRYSEWMTDRRRDVVWSDVNDWSTYETMDKALVFISQRLESEYDKALLGACAMAHSGKFIHVFAPVVRRLPQDLKDEVTDIVTGRYDLMGKLFRLLVPRIMDKRTFYRMFGCPSRWKLRYSEAQREKLYLKLLDAGFIN